MDGRGVCWSAPTSRPPSGRAVCTPAARDWWRWRLGGAPGHAADALAVEPSGLPARRRHRRVPRPRPLPPQPRDEVFATPLTREQPSAGHAGVILPGSVAWVDLDDRGALARLRAFLQRPTLVVASGSGGAHAYWRLAHEHSADDIEAANRKLCAALEGDAACTDRARIMRVPGTVNHKAGRACRLLYVDLARPGIELASLVAGLTDPAPPPPPPTAADLRRRRALRSDDPARDVPPATYFRLLAGVQVPDHGGHIPCPLPDHVEEIQSCRVYATAEEGWRCYGCRRGGTIYDLASLLDHGPWGRGLRREAFRETRRRVHTALGLNE
jgi:hypothetical protein